MEFQIDHLFIQAISMEGDINLLIRNVKNVRPESFWFDWTDIKLRCFTSAYFDSLWLIKNYKIEVNECSPKLWQSRFVRVFFSIYRIVEVMSIKRFEKAVCLPPRERRGLRFGRRAIVHVYYYNYWLFESGIGRAGERPDTCTRV